MSWWNRAYLGSCDDMAAIPDGSVHCCVTSPPYFGLRDYGVAGQIGLERAVDEYVERLVAVFREVRRVLRDDGTLWLNIADSYAARPRGSDNGWDKSRLTNPGGAQKAQRASMREGMEPRDFGEAKPKDLLMVPALVALALRRDGWWLRDEIVWYKPNPMPSSVDDRCTPAHEKIFLLAKRARYFADMDAERTPLTESSLRRHAQPGFDEQHGSDRANAGTRRTAPMKPAVKYAFPRGWAQGDEPHHVVEYSRGDYRASKTESRARSKTAADPNARGMRQAPEPGEPNAFHPLGANLRNVWEISTTPFSTTRYVCEGEGEHDFLVPSAMSREEEAVFRCRTCGAGVRRDSHFATFPEELARRCISIGSSAGGCCSACGAPYRRVAGRACPRCNALVPTQAKECGCGHRNIDWRDERTPEPAKMSDDYSQPGRSVPRRVDLESKRIAGGFAPTCGCGAPAAPCVVLDPFGGSGTTAAVAESIGRRWVLYEISPTYHRFIEERTRQAGLFAL